MNRQQVIWMQGYAYKTAALARAELDRAEELGFNRVLFYAGGGKSMWRSALLDWYSYVTEAFDPLEYAVNYAKSIGLEAEAWYSCGSIPRNWTAKLSGPHPEWDVASGLAYNGTAFPSGFHCLDFRIESARAFIVSVAQELKAKFPALSAIHLDTIRWILPSPETYTLAQYYGPDCADYILQTVQNVSAAIAPMPLTVAVFKNSFGTLVGQNWDTWFQYVSRVYPMAYFNVDHTFGATWAYLEDVLNDYAALPEKAQVFPGLSYFDKSADNPPKTITGLATQVQLCSDLGFYKLSIFDQRVTDEQMAAVNLIGGVDYVVIVNLLPQDATKAEKQFVVDLVHDSKQTICQSADDAKWLVGRGEPGSKVVAWNPERWSDDILAWLSPVTIEIKRF